LRNVATRESDWDNELHLTNAKFKEAAEVIAQKIDQIAAQTGTA
jgi:hypothetical protein